MTCFHHFLPSGPPAAPHPGRWRGRARLLPRGIVEGGGRSLRQVAAATGFGFGNPERPRGALVRLFGSAPAALRRACPAQILTGKASRPA